jgi:hypothetical protein
LLDSFEEEWQGDGEGPGLLPGETWAMVAGGEPSSGSRGGASAGSGTAEPLSAVSLFGVAGVSAERRDWGWAPPASLDGAGGSSGGVRGADERPPASSDLSRLAESGGGARQAPRFLFVVLEAVDGGSVLDEIIDMVRPCIILAQSGEGRQVE